MFKTTNKYMFKQQIRTFSNSKYVHFQTKKRTCSNSKYVHFQTGNTYIFKQQTLTFSNSKYGHVQTANTYMFKQYINSCSNRKYVNCSQNLVKSSIFEIAIWTCFKQQYLHQTTISACFKQQYLHVSNSNTYMFQTAIVLHVLICLWISSKGTNIIYRCVHNLQT